MYMFVCVCVCVCVCSLFPLHRCLQFATSLQIAHYQPPPLVAACSMAPCFNHLSKIPAITPPVPQDCLMPFPFQSLITEDRLLLFPLQSLKIVKYSSLSHLQSLKIAYSFLLQSQKIASRPLITVSFYQALDPRKCRQITRALPVQP